MKVKAKVVKKRVKKVIEVQKVQMDGLSLDLGREDLNLVVAKINEIVVFLNK